MPKVTIITLTKDRRKFIPALIRNVAAQTWPKDDLEWLIVDDGEDKIEDLVKDISYVKYRYYKDHLAIGHKRNIANSLARGDYIFYFDDDDYSFPKRVAVGVRGLDNTPQAMIIGSSDMFIYDTDLKKIYVCGPFGPKHGTEGTWGFRRSLLEQTRYEDSLMRATESSFTKSWSIPVYQVGRTNTIVATDHGGNSVSKKHLIQRTKEFYDLEQIILDKEACEFLKSL